MIGFNGGLIGAARDTSIAQSVPGIWTPGEQVVARGRGLWPGPFFQLFPAAAGAYSLRQLAVSETTNVVRVRRSSDDAESDFTAIQVSDGTLASWVGAGNDGFVRTLYDQSGNGNHASETTQASQPQIVSSGALLTKNGRPVMSFFNRNLVATISGLRNFSALSVFCAWNPQVAAGAEVNAGSIFTTGAAGSNTSNRGMAFGCTPTISLTNERFVIYWASGSLAGRLGSTTYAHSADSQNMMTGFMLSAGTSVFQNGSQVSLNLSAGTINTSTNTSPSASGMTSDTVNIGGYLTPVNIDSRMHEIIFYSTDQRSNRSAIETNIMAHYGIS